MFRTKHKPLEEEFEEHGIQFSLPLRHTYWNQDNQQGPLDVTVRSDGVFTTSQLLKESDQEEKAQ